MDRICRHIETNGLRCQSAAVVSNPRPSHWPYPTPGIPGPGLASASYYLLATPCSLPFPLAPAAVSAKIDCVTVKPLNSFQFNRLEANQNRRTVPVPQYVLAIRQKTKRLQGIPKSLNFRVQPLYTIASAPCLLVHSLPISNPLPKQTAQEPITTRRLRTRLAIPRAYPYYPQQKPACKAGG